MSENNKIFSSVFGCLLFLFFPEERRKTIIDELEEVYFQYRSERGFIRANIWILLQITKIITGKIYNICFWSLPMLRNYLLIAVRNLKRHKGFSFINITGLAVGMTCCILISLWILEELNYDTFHRNAGTLFQAVKSYQNSSVRATPVLLAPALKEEMPEILETTRYHSRGQVMLNYRNNPFNENRAYYVDPAFLRMFDFNLYLGDRNTALESPNSIVITRNIADKYFGKENPIGKSLLLNNEYELVVTGVLENVPFNSIFNFTILLPYEMRLVLNIKEGYVPSWGHNEPFTFIQLQENASAESVNSKLKTYLGEKYQIVYPEETAELPFEQLPSLSMVSLINIRFSPIYGGSGRKAVLSIFFATAFVILLIACINFMNLSTARSSKRAKEIGLRKVVGAGRKHIIRQFLGESILLSFLALILALILTILLLPGFNSLFDRNIDISSLGNTAALPFLLGITLFTGIAGGSYPALYLSSFQPVKTLKGNLRSGMKRVLLRRILVVFQFVLSISLIIGTAVIYDQLNFVQNKDLGFDKEHIVCIPLNSGSLDLYDTFKNRLTGDPRIINLSSIHDRPTWIGSSSTYSDWEGKDPNFEPLIGHFRTNYDFIKTMNIELKEGRDFSIEFQTDRENSFLINEEMKRVMEMDDVIGKRLMYSGFEGTIIGVVKDFHFLPLSEPMRPLVIRLAPEKAKFMVIRISPDNISSSLDYIRETWEEVLPSYQFDYSFLDSDLGRMYNNEQKIGQLMQVLAIIAILIACLGMFGLASFTADQRTKECGVRKVLGATVSDIVGLLSKEFLILVLISNIIAWPLSYYFMDKWLQSYAYRTNISILLLLFASFIALAVTLITVSSQALKAARANPVDSLRYE